MVRTTPSSTPPPEEEAAPTYTAWDGTVFEELQAFMKYEMETRYTFKGETGESETKLPGEIEGQPFDLIDLDDCEVQLLDHTDRVKVRNVLNSKVFVGACSSQVIVSHCRDCTFTIATREFYAHDTENCTFFLYCATPPEIEAATCHSLAFAPFNGNYPQLQENMAQAGLDPEENRWWVVLPIVASDSEASAADVEQEVTVPEGCYRLMSEEEYAAGVTPWEPLGECELSIPPLWPASPASTATTANAEAYLSHPHGAADGDGFGEAEEEEDVQVITSPDQLFPSAAAPALHGKATGGGGGGGGGGERPLPASSSTNTLVPALSAPGTPFSSQDGTAAAARGRAQSHQPQPPQQPPQLQQQLSAGEPSAGLPPREQRSLSHQPSQPSSASSSSLVGLAGAGIGGSAAPSPFSSARGGASAASAASSPFNSSRGGSALLAPSASSASLSAGVEEKKEGGLLPMAASASGPPQEKEEGTTLASFDYDRWHAAWEERLRAKAAQEQQVARAAQAKAAQDLDAFYDRATDAKALRQERNREAEEATLAWVAESEARSDESPFGRVLELVGASDSGRGPDMSRFRGLMIMLREEGLPTKHRARRSTTPGADEDDSLRDRGEDGGDDGRAAPLGRSASNSSQAHP